MRRFAVIMLAALLAAGAATAQWNSVRARGQVAESNVVVWARYNEIIDSGVSFFAMTNANAQATNAWMNATNAYHNATNAYSTATNILDTVTNTTANLELTTRKNQPNGYAGLNSEGKLDAEMVETITVVFAGGEAVDVE